ncbi:hypothetical protein NL676_001851 [Syzygium grande]|nr:hypothetical protein NL676_001851 [Syzygium grande]
MEHCYPSWKTILRAIRPPAGTDLRLRLPVPITAIIAPSRALTAVASDLRLSVPTFAVASARPRAAGSRNSHRRRLRPPADPDLRLVSGKGLDLYSDIGKKAKGQSPSLIDHLVSSVRAPLSRQISSTRTTRATTSSTSLPPRSREPNKERRAVSRVNTQLKNKNVTTDVKVDTNSNLVTKITVDEPCPGLKTIFSFKVRDQRNNKGNSLTASYYHIVNLVTKIAIGAEVTHSFSSNVNTITVGTQHALDALTMLKARINNSGKASALIQHEWRPRSFFTVSGEVDTKSIDKSAKVGLALAIKP